MYSARAGGFLLDSLHSPPLPRTRATSMNLRITVAESGFVRGLPTCLRSLVRSYDGVDTVFS